MNKKTFKGKEYFSSLFDTEVRLFKPEKSNELMASLTKLAEFLPTDIDYEKNIDLVPIAFDAFVANRRNKNNQVIGTNKALEIVDNFKYKFIDIEHNRENLIGVILTVGFTSFGENSKPLTREEVQDMDEPFNVVCGGVIWPVVDEDLVARIEESSNELSKIYKKISASWELLSSDLEIAVFDKDEKNLINATIDKERKYEKDLITAGGTGKSKDGKIICDLISGDTLPVGMGLTTNPAAEVEGVLAGSNKLKNTDIEASFDTTGEMWIGQEVVSKKDFEALKSDFDKIIANLQQKTEKNDALNANKIKNSVDKDKEKRIMKLNSIKDINDENIKELSASALDKILREEIKDRLQEKAEEYAAEKERLEAEANQKEEEYQNLVSSNKDLKEKYDAIKSELDNLKAAEQQRIAQENFNSRMEIISSEYELSDKARKIIANKVKNIKSDEDFDAYKEELSAFLSPKSSDSSDDVDQSAQSVLASSLDNADQDSNLLNNNDSSDEDYKSMWAQAAEAITIQKTRK